MHFKHRFYLKSKREQRYFQLRLVIISAILWIAIGIPFVLKGGYVVPIIFVPVILSIIAPFIDVPALVKSGRLRHYSPLFLSEEPRAEKVNIHGGSLFDYYFVLEKHMTVRQRKTYILYSYLEGLDRLITDLSRHDHPPKKVIGSTYFLQERTAKKLGFNSQQPSLMTRLLFIYNYLNILLSSSLVNKKVYFPKVAGLRTYTATLTDLVAHQELIQTLKINLRKSYESTI